MKKYFKTFFNWLQKERPRKNEINYLYFISLLAFLILLSLFHFLSYETPLVGIPLFFLLQAFGQAFLEVGLFLLVAYLLKRWAPRWTHLLFISLCFFFLLIHFTDFTLARLMDTSIAYPIKFFLGGGAGNILTAFQALNMNSNMLLIIAGTLVALPLMGLFFYWLTYRLAHIKPLSISLNQIAIGLCSVFVSLFLLDVLVHPFLNRHVYAKYKKALPFKTTFISPAPRCIQLPAPFASFRNEEETIAHIPSLSISQKPNIYLFVIETLRKDFVTEEIAPKLVSFAQENIQFPSSFSNANSTHLSWFAIFHSDIPYHWTAMRDHWETGSIPLQILKKIGYKIRIYSSSDLRYFNMDKVIFGQNRDLADQIEEYTCYRELEPCDRDILAFESFSRDLQNEEAKEGNLFIFFLDSTHSEYSFPANHPPKFEPISKEIDYLTIGPKSRELEFIKNRYRNAIHHVDRLIGDFFQQLKNKNLYDDAIIAITGDHGEEFFEEGALFHGTHLNHYQTSVPLFFKFPAKKQKKIQTQEATHLNLFPSILDYLTNLSDFSSLFDGQSIFSSVRWPYRITVTHNGPDTPCEFAIEGKGTKLQLRFPPNSNIYNQSSLEIIDIKTSPENETLDAYIEAHFPNAIPSLLEKKEKTPS